MRILFLRSQGQSKGDGCELMATANSIFAKAVAEDAAHGGDEGTASGEKDAIDISGIDAGALEKGVNGCLDGFQIVGDPHLKFMTCDGNAQIEAAVVKAEFGGFALGKGELYPLNCLVQLVSKILLNDGDQGLNLFGFEGAQVSAFENFAHIVGAKEGEIVPAFEVGVDPSWNGR